MELLTKALSWRRKGYVEDGTNCVMSTQAISSLKSNQKAVEAKPPHEHSPSDTLDPTCKEQAINIGAPWQGNERRAASADRKLPS